MRAPPRQEGWADLVPGIASVGAFLGLLGLLGASWLWLCALLAVSVYFGVAWLRPAPKLEPQEVPTVPPRERLQQLQQMGSALPDGRLRRGLATLRVQAEEILGYLDAHPSESAESLFIVQQFLELTYSGVQRYLEAARHSLASARQSEQTLSELLDGISERLGGLKTKLANENDAELAMELQVLNRTLEDLDKIVLNLGDKSE